MFWEHNRSSGSQQAAFVFRCSEVEQLKAPLIDLILAVAPPTFKRANPIYPFEIPQPFSFSLAILCVINHHGLTEGCASSPSTTTAFKPSKKKA
jgi:hypothetical protein